MLDINNISVMLISPTANKEKDLKCSQFRRWLEARGVEFKAGKGTSHFKIYANGEMTIFADHGSKELDENIRKAIIKKLKLKD